MNWKRRRRSFENGIGALALAASVVTSAGAADLHQQDASVPVADDIRKAVRIYVEDDALRTIKAEHPGDVIIADPARITQISDVYCAPPTNAGPSVNCKFTVDWATGWQGYFVATFAKEAAGWRIATAKSVYRKP
jgi:hypothetical protein